MSRRSSRSRSIKSYVEPSINDIPSAPSDSEDQVEPPAKKFKVDQKKVKAAPKKIKAALKKIKADPISSSDEHQNDDDDDDDDDNDDDESFNENDAKQPKEEGDDDNDEEEDDESSEAAESQTPKKRAKRGRPKQTPNSARKATSISSASKRDYGPLDERTCPLCKKVFTIVTGLAYHLEHQVCQRTKKRVSIDVIGTVPFRILDPGQLFSTKYGVVRVVKDDRAGEDFGTTKIAKNYKDLKKKFQRIRDRNSNRKSKVYMFVAKKSRQKRDVLLQHYLNYKSQDANGSLVGLSGTPSEEYVEGIWNEYYPHSTPTDIFTGIFMKSLAIPYITVDYPDDTGEDPAAPPDSYPDRMVECVLVRDERKTVYDLDREGEGRLSQVGVAKSLVRKTQDKMKLGRKRKRSNSSDDDGDDDDIRDLHESGMRIFIRRRELVEIYNAGLPVYLCDTCGKKFNSRAGFKSHLEQQSCIKEREHFRKNRVERLIEVDESIEAELKPPPWILPPIVAPPGEKRRKRCKVLPGHIVFHPQKSSIYPGVWKQLKMKRGSNNSKFMAKIWDSIGSGRKKPRKSRARKNSVRSVVHQVNKWMDVSDLAIYPGVMAFLFPTTEERLPSRRAASRKANEQVSQYLKGNEEESVNMKEDEYNPVEDDDLDGGDFFQSDNFDIDTPMPPLLPPPLTTPKKLETVLALCTLPVTETHTNSAIQPIAVGQLQVAASASILMPSSTRDELEKGKADLKVTKEPPKKRRRRAKTESSTTTTPAAPIIVDIQPLVEEIRAGRYPSMKVYNGDHLNICFFCKTQDDNVLNCEFCSNSEHLGCLKTKVCIRDPEPGDEFMCHRCLQTVLNRRSRAERRRLEKLNDALKGNSATPTGISLEQAKNAAALKREVIWSQSEFDNHVASYSKCPTGGPGGLICCGPCTASYSRLLSETAKEMEVQTLSGVGREVSELLELMHDAQVRLQQAVDVSNSNSIRRDMLRDGDDQENGNSARGRNSGLLGIIDIFTSK